MKNMFNLIESHDTIRILRRLNDNKDRAKIAYLLMFLSAGAPNIYYGGEVALTGDHDPDNRKPMIWDINKQDLDFLNFIKTLINLRNKYPSFKVSDYTFINDEDLLIFTKEFENEQLLVIINNNDSDKTISLPNILNKTYLNVFNNEIFNCDKIELEAYKFIVLLKI